MSGSTFHMEMLWWLLLRTNAMTTGSTIYIANKFEINSTKGPFSHMVLNEKTGNVYAGAMNNLYQLSSDLMLIKSATTGPKDDNPNCQPHYSTASCDQPLKPMNTYNKALVIDYNNNKLIACSSLYHGICERYNLRDIESKNPDIYVPVVANNATSTTVAFIAPGPSDNVLQSDVLYVAASRTNAGQSVFRDLVPAIASRKLETFDLFYSDVSASSSKSFEARLRDNFPVYYIYGFNSDKFSYFVTVQKQNHTTESYISKLIRVCQADKHYNSYAEVQLKCMHNGAFYNLVQAAYVAKAGSSLAKTIGISELEDVLYVVCSIGNPNTAIPGSDSALCVYSMRTVRRIFTENIKDCFDGIGNIGPSHVISRAVCRKSNISISDEYCGTYDINTPIDGQNPIQTEAAITFSTTVSAVAVTSKFQNNIAFVGTVNGHIIKVSIKSALNATAYEDMTVEDGSKIYSDMFFDSDRRHLYALTDRKIYKLKVQECTQYTTCKSCLGANDPYCGWCLLENKCSLQKECEKHKQGIRWLTSCTTITHVVPDKIQKEHEKNIQLRLSISNLPIYHGKYECVFRGGIVSIQTQANRTDTHIITCDTPPSNQLPPTQTDEDHIVMQLSVSCNGNTFVSTNIIFFDCGSHISCTSCTLSDFPCYWCIKNHVCTFNTSGCPGNKLVLGKNVKPAALLSHNEGPHLCPRIHSDKIEIFVPSETNTNIVVTALNLEDFQTSLSCFFNLNNCKQVNAKVTRLPSGETIIECELIYFSYLGNTSDMKVPFQISWAPNKPLDNPEKIQVIMYKCDKMADSCGGCLTLKSQFKCGWCDRYCTIKSRCYSMWFSSAVTCPNPEITKIEPTSGPKDGGTYLTITGKDLGTSFGDINSGVFIENGDKVLCTPVKELYIASVKIVCVTGASSITGTGQLVVTVNRQYDAKAKDIQFSYVNPVLVKITPSQGPKSGGTLVTLSGYDMNAGTKRTVWIGNYSCEVKSFNSSMLTCVTSMGAEGMVEKVSVQFDKMMVTNSINYQYTTDPTIATIDPKVAIVSGGIRINVTGTQLNIIQDPKMILWDGDKKYEGDCKVASPTQMHCYSPQVEAIHSNSNTNSTIEKSYSYGFILDSVTEVLKLTEKDKITFGIFRIVPDPVFESFTSNLEITYQSKKDNYLIINGYNLIDGATQNDYSVTIGGSNCTIKSVWQSMIICLIPNKTDKVNYNKVQVHLGKYLSKDIGYLIYTEKDEAGHGVSMQVVIICTVFSAVFLIVLLVIVIIMKWRGIGCFHDRIHQPPVRYGPVAEVDTESEEKKMLHMQNKSNDCTDIMEAGGPVIDNSTLGVLKDARLMINRDWLRLGDIIGKGHFGCVLKGYLSLPDDKVDNLVAIKTLHKNNLRDIDIDAFLREILMMKRFHHPNVLQLLGICLELNDMPLMVLPFMEHGDLLSYIRDNINMPTVKDLLHFGIDIAEGMAYLSDQKFVHRDLAARNCMLDEALNVKVADFGLSREIYEREYYTSDNKKTKLPLRWMAPESMEKGTYNSKSDVWSYGVVLWELMTRGVTPYPEVDNWDILRYLKKGRRLPQPQYCPDTLYDIMQKCWLVDPHDRPTFSVLAREITDMVSVVEHSMQQGLLRIDIHSMQVNEADSSKYHYAYDDSYLEPPTRTGPVCVADNKNNLDNSYLELLDDTNDVQICPRGGDNSKDKCELYHDERKSLQICATDNSYLEVLSYTPVQTESLDGANATMAKE